MDDGICVMRVDGIRLFGSYKSWVESKRGVVKTHALDFRTSCIVTKIGLSIY